MSPQRWRRVRRALTLGLFVAVCGLMFMLIKTLDWQQVRQALMQYRPATLLLGLGLSALGYAVFSSFDVLGRYHVGHGLPVRRVYPIAFVCNAFNLNLSSWVGAIALRYRLYSRQGLKTADITRVLTLSLITNWFGYLLLAGVLFCLGLPRLPASWGVSSTLLRVIGVALLLLGLAYLMACRFATRRAWRWRSQELTLPSWRLALLQGVLGANNWALMALLIYTLLPAGVAYPHVLATLMISSVAGLITHIPAGLGVLEMVFVALLRGEVKTGAIIAALIAYRALYYLLPLALATLTYLVLERQATSEKRQADSTARP